MRLLLYTGKGGVGKTTNAAATAVAAAERGWNTLVASSDAAHSLGDVLETRLGPEPINLRLPGSVVGAHLTPRGVAGRLDAVEIDARAEMEHHWGRVRDYLVALFRYQGIEEVVAEELALLPGAEELTSLLAVERLATAGGYECVVLDCAPTDSTLRLVTLPEVAHGALRLLLRLQRSIAAVVTPLTQGVVPAPLPDSGVFRDAEDLLYKKLRALRRLLVDDETSVRLVVTPERMVIDEARRAYTDLCLFELNCDAVIMNRMLPREAGDEEFFREWWRVQGERRIEVAEAFAPLRLLEAPLQDDEVTGLERLARHGRALFADEDPVARLAEGPRLRFERDEDGTRLEFPLPGARRSELELSKVDDELVVRAGTLRRAIKLPPRIAALDVKSARLADGVLHVHFESAAPAHRRAGDSEQGG